MCACGCRCFECPRWAVLISIFAFIFGVCQMLFAMGSIRRVRWPNLHQVMMLQTLCCQLPRPNCTNVFACICRGHALKATPSSRSESATRSHAGSTVLKTVPTACRRVHVCSCVLTCFGACVRVCVCDRKRQICINMGWTFVGYVEYDYRVQEWAPPNGTSAYVDSYGMLTTPMEDPRSDANYSAVVWVCCEWCTCATLASTYFFSETACALGRHN